MSYIYIWSPLTLEVYLCRRCWSGSVQRLHFPQTPSSPGNSWLLGCTFPPSQRTQTPHLQPSCLSAQKHHGPISCYTTALWRKTNKVKGLCCSLINTHIHVFLWHGPLSLTLGAGEDPRGEHMSSSQHGVTALSADHHLWAELLHGPKNTREERSHKLGFALCDRHSNFGVYSTEQRSVTPFQPSHHTLGHRQEAAAHLEFSGEGQSEGRRPLLTSCTSAASTTTCERWIINDHSLRWSSV